MSTENQYAAAGVDYRKVEGFRSGSMKELALATAGLPKQRRILVRPSGSWSHIRHQNVSYRTVTEGPGNKLWLTAWMYQKTGVAMFGAGAWDTMLAAINDLASTGHMPVTMTDDIVVHDYGWFSDRTCRDSLMEGFSQCCAYHQMALTGGETASLKYLSNPAPPVENVPTMSASVMGVLEPAYAEVQPRVKPGNRLLGTPSSGAQVNGYSLILKLGLDLPKQFLTELPNGRTFGSEALIPALSYAPLVESLMKSGIAIHGFLPATGDGLRKLLRMGEHTYRIKHWVSIPPILQFVRGLGVSPEDYLTTFNNGIGYYIFVSSDQNQVDRAIEAAAKAGYPLYDLGVVEEGPARVIFEPENITILPRQDE